MSRSLRVSSLLYPHNTKGWKGVRDCSAVSLGNERTIHLLGHNTKEHLGEKRRGNEDTTSNLSEVGMVGIFGNHTFEK